MRFFRLPITIALFSVLAITGSAYADTFDFTVTGSSGTFSGAGTLTATSIGSGEYLITAITGTGVTGLIAPGGFNGNDNLLFPSSLPQLDSKGFSFIDVNGPDKFDVNIFNNGSGYFAYLQDEDHFIETVPVTFEAATTTIPEPSTLFLLSTGLLGLTRVVRRKSF
jgi:PEP-CTERM motif